MNSIILASTLHDPESSLAMPLREALPVIQRNYKKWVVTATTTTGQEVLDMLRNAGVEVVIRENKLSPDPIEDNHLFALEVGSRYLEQGDKLQYTDGDRVIHAGAYFAKEVDRVAALGKGEISNYVSLTRSAKDNASHHVPLTLTEQSFTRVYQKALGKKVDPGSTAHIFSEGLCRYILENSSKHDIMSFPHGKWEILAKEGGFSMEAIETEGMLSFETPLQFREKMTADAFIKGSASPEEARKLRRAHKGGKLPRLESLREYFRFMVEADQQIDPREWAHRLNLADQWIRYIEKEAGNLGLSKEHMAELKNLVDTELKTLGEFREKIINEGKQENKYSELRKH